MKAIISCVTVCLALAAWQTNTSAADNFYIIGPGDVLEISVWNEPDLSKKLIVPPDGVISFPLINPIKVTNFSITDLKKAVTKGLLEYIPDATVTVMLVKINSLKAYVIGKVKQAGEFPITLETSVLQILAKAGGLTPFASENNIKILRRKNNQIINIPFDYGEVEKGKNLEQNIILQAGDVVLVP